MLYRVSALKSLGLNCSRLFAEQTEVDNYVAGMRAAYANSSDLAVARVQVVNITCTEDGGVVPTIVVLPTPKKDGGGRHLLRVLAEAPPPKITLVVQVCVWGVVVLCLWAP